MTHLRERVRAYAEKVRNFVDFQKLLRVAGGFAARQAATIGLAAMPRSPLLNASLLAVVGQQLLAHQCCLTLSQRSRRAYGMEPLSKARSWRAAH